MAVGSTDDSQLLLLYAIHPSQAAWSALAAACGHPCLLYAKVMEVVSLDRWGLF